MLQEAELSPKLIQRTPRRLLRDYVLHRTRCTQEDDQLLRQGRGWSCVSRRQDWIDPPGAGSVDPNDASASYHRHGGDDLHRVDLRSPASACREGEGSASVDVAGDRCRQEEERPNRCRQDRRLLALRFPAQVPHGIDRDPRPAHRNLSASPLSDIAAAGYFALHAACWRRL